MYYTSGIILFLKNNMSRSTLFTSFLSLMVAYSGAVSAEEQSQKPSSESNEATQKKTQAKDLVKQFIHDVETILKKDVSPAEKKASLVPVLGNVFNIEAFAMFIFRNNKELSESSTYHSLLTRHIINQYYDVVSGEDATKNTLTVKDAVVVKGDTYIVHCEYVNKDGEKTDIFFDIMDGKILKISAKVAGKLFDISDIVKQDHQNLFRKSNSTVTTFIENLQSMLQKA